MEAVRSRHQVGERSTPMRRRAPGAWLVWVALAGLAAGPLAPEARAQEAPAGDAGLAMRVYEDLTPVRQNLPLLGTPVCVFVGFFPRDEIEDWATEAMRAPEVVLFADRVTFVRHRRSEVRDLEEQFLRKRGLPRAQAWQGVLVLDRDAEKVAIYEAPVHPARLRRALQEAVEHGVGATRQTFLKPGPPAFQLDLGEGLAVADLAPADADVALRARDGAARVRIQARRVGPDDTRGEVAVQQEIAVLRYERSLLSEAATERAMDHGEARGVLWSYRLKQPTAAVRARAQALIGIKGDLYTITAESADLAPTALEAIVRDVLERATLGETDETRTGETGDKEP